MKSTAMRADQTHADRRSRRSAREQYVVRGHDEGRHEGQRCATANLVRASCIVRDRDELHRRLRGRRLRTAPCWSHDARTFARVLVEHGIGNEPVRRRCRCS